MNPNPADATGNSALADARAATNIERPVFEQGPSVRGQARQTAWDESMSAAGRLNTMLGQDSPLMQSAALRGNQAAARRGMLNSSMGVESAQRAMIDAAAPIAMADAQMFGQQSMANTREANTWDTLDLDRMQNDRQYAATNALEYQKLETTAKLKAAELGIDWAKAQQSERLDLLRMAQQEGQFQQTYGLESDRLDNDIAQFAARLGVEVAQLDLEYDRMSQQDKQFYDKLRSDRSNIELEWERKYGLENLAQRNRIELNDIEQEDRIELETLGQDFKRQIAGDEHVANAWGLMMREIGAIQNNPDLDPDQKRINIQNVLGGFRSFATWASDETGLGMSVSQLLAFGVTDVDEDATSRNRPDAGPAGQFDAAGNRVGGEAGG